MSGLFLNCLCRVDGAQWGMTKPPCPAPPSGEPTRRQWESLLLGWTHEIRNRLNGISLEAADLAEMSGGELDAAPLHQRVQEAAKLLAELREQLVLPPEDRPEVTLGELFEAITQQRLSLAPGLPERSDLVLHMNAAQVAQALAWLGQMQAMTVQIESAGAALSLLLKFSGASSLPWPLPDVPGRPFTRAEMTCWSAGQLLAQNGWQAAAGSATSESKSVRFVYADPNRG
jgi:hypothetical protein